jgi:hypothetical protein
MGTDKLVFAVELCGGATGSDMTGNDVTGSDVSHVTGSDHVRKYVLRMRNRKSHHICPSRAFWAEVTKSRDWKRPCPEVALNGSRFCACLAIPRVFLVVVTWLPDVTEGHLTPSGFPLSVRNWKLRNTRCVHGVFSTTSASYDPRKPLVILCTQPEVVQHP